MLSICTENEVTLAMGASVPTTKLGPEVALFMLALFMELLQPAARKTPAVSKGRASLKSLLDNVADISGASLSAGCRACRRVTVFLASELNRSNPVRCWAIAF
jgi:hypothetical protein